MTSNTNHPLASTPSSTKGYPPPNLSDLYSISRVTVGDGVGDMTLADIGSAISLNQPVAAATTPTDVGGIDEPDAILGKGLVNRQKNLSWKRIKSTLSRTQIVELFSRSNSIRLKPGGSSNKNGNRMSELSTIFSEEDSQPTLLSAQRKPSTPGSLKLSQEDNVRLQKKASCSLEVNEDKADSSTTPTRKIAGAMSAETIVVSNENQYPSFSKQKANTLSKSPRSKSKLVDLPRNFLNSSMARLMSASKSRNMNESMPTNDATITIVKSANTADGDDSADLKVEKIAYEKLLASNKKLTEELQELWKDNRLLLTALEESETKLEELKSRNSYLETTMLQEGKVLSNIIKDCHVEIKRLKMTQCELLRNNNENGVECSKEKEEEMEAKSHLGYKIREYYIGKYASDDTNVMSPGVFPVYVPPPGSPLRAFFHGLPESVAE